MSFEKSNFGDLPIITVLNSTNGASMKLTLLGGSIYSYITSDGTERLFLSKSSKTDGSKSLRGGIPIVFPQFGPGRLKQHGFARGMNWTFDESSVKQDGDNVSFVVYFTNSPETMELFPFEFHLELFVTFNGHSFETKLKVDNTSQQDFRFQYLLHTYHLLPCDISETTIRGLDGLKNVDKLKSFGEMLSYFKGDLIIDTNHDAIYANESLPNKTISVLNKSEKEMFKVDIGLFNGEKEVPCDVVVWNPWVDGKKMSDFDNDGYKSMVCIEPGCVNRYETCCPKSSWTLTQKVTYNL